jgi:hypothetical protein
MKRGKHHFIDFAETKISNDILQIAKRAYELYEQRGRQDGLDLQDWTQAEQEIQDAANRK